jgi:hypothetical protein
MMTYRICENKKKLLFLGELVQQRALISERINLVNPDNYMIQSNYINTINSSRSSGLCREEEGKTMVLLNIPFLGCV